MDKRKLTLIENETKIDEKKKETKKPSRQTNPIAKKMMEFHQEQVGKFSVKDLFKK